MKPCEKSDVSQAEFFGWKKNPFVDSANDTEAFLTSIEQRKMLTCKELIKMGKSFALTGPSGVGKTSFLRQIMLSLDSCLYKTIHVPYGGLDRSGLLKAIASACNLDILKRGLPPLLRIQQFMVKLSQDQTPVFPVLIIDDAQLLPQDSFMDLCSLLFDPGQNRSSMSLILAGDETLEAKLKLNIMTPIQTRLACILKCEPINEKETIGFIQHRIAMSKASKDIIGLEAMTMISAQCRGNRRAIMNTGALLLLEAMSRGDKTIGAQEVLNSTFWNKSG